MKRGNVAVILALGLSALLPGPSAQAQFDLMTPTLTVPMGPVRPQPAFIGPASVAPFSLPWAGQPVNPGLLFAAGPYNEVVPTDPLIRQTQIDTVPAGVLSSADLRRGVGVASVPGAGNRLVRITGPVIRTAAGPAVGATDAETGVALLAVIPPGLAEGANASRLVSAKVTRVTNDAAIVERNVAGQTITEIIPKRSVFVADRGRFVQASAVRRLRRGAQVFIPSQGGPRGMIRFSRLPARSAARVSPVSMAVGR